MKKKNHLPIFGVGPLYVISILLITAFLVYLDSRGVFSQFKVNSLKIVFQILGIFLALEGLIIWVFAVIISRIDDKIKDNKLITTGIYRYVRNPIYSAFLFVCTAVILFLNNYLFLLAPIFFWIFLTLLMKNTEEKWLIKKYGNAYLEYSKATNRCIPFFKKIKS